MGSANVYGSGISLDDILSYTPDPSGDMFM